MYYYKIIGQIECVVELEYELNLNNNLNDLVHEIFVNTNQLSIEQYYKLNEIVDIEEITVGEYFDFIENQAELELIDYYNELEQKEKEAKRHEKIYGVTAIADNGNRYWLDDKSKSIYKTTFNINDATKYDLEQAIKIVKRKNKEKTGRHWQVQNLKNQQIVELN